MMGWFLFALLSDILGHELVKTIDQLLDHSVEVVQVGAVCLSGVG